MGVHKLKRRGATTYGINFMVKGKQQQEVAGTDKRAAERLYRQRLREVKAGTYIPNAKSGAITLSNYSQRWLEQRTNRSKAEDAQRLRDHILPRVGHRRLGELSQIDVVKLVKDLQADGRIGIKTAKNAYGAFRTLIRDARIAGLICRGSVCLTPPDLERAGSCRARDLQPRGSDQTHHGRAGRD